MLKRKCPKLYSLLTILYVFVCKKKQNIKWYTQYILAKFQCLYPRRFKKLEIAYSERISILVPHADDEWIGTYAVLNLHPKHLNCIYFNLYGGNVNKNNIKIRNEEIKASSVYWNFNIINNYDFDVDSLYKILSNSSICFIPSPYDWHNEHREVFKTFVKAYNLLTELERSNLQVYYFCVSLPHSYEEEQYYIPLTKKDLYNQWKIFPSVYNSQSFMPAFRFKLQSRLIPPHIGYAAQTFIKVNMNIIKTDYYLINMPNVIKKLTDLKKYINNITCSRKILVQIKEEINHDDNS